MSKAAPVTTLTPATRNAHEDGIACMWMRGGTSKGGMFLASDLPSDPAQRDAALLAIMGSPDQRQIDGMGGADPLTSKVAIVSKSERLDADVEYLFLQVFVDQAIVTDAQNCGNILSAVGPFAIEHGLITPTGDETNVRIFMRNTGKMAIANIQTPNGTLTYQGDARIDGVPGTHAPINVEFCDTAGSTCGALLPSGKAVDTINGIDCTLIDNGMPSVVIRAADVGITGYESREELDANTALKTKIETIRLQIGEVMNLGNVREKSVPKMMLIAPPKNGGAITVRSFIPHRAHASIGVLGAVSVATACLVQGSVADGMAKISDGAVKTLSIEHPSGETSCVLKTDDNGDVVSSALLRTARKLMDGKVFL